jgi:N-acetyl sugar amidotransferase
MNRCIRCCIPDTRPDTHFAFGVCSACLSYENRPRIDWEARKRELVALLDRHDGRCIVPSSGGKDSHYQVLTLLELGADVTVVTATTCMLTEIGRRNIDNLARYARTVEVTPNRIVRAKLNRLGLQLVGDISWPEHVAIFSTPFRMAADLGIPLIFYGENPQNQYGGPPGAEEARQMTQRWRSEFGGFLGLRPSDLIGMEGITARDMADYEMPGNWAIVATGLRPGRVGGMEAHFLGQYVPWDSHRNALKAHDAGMLQQRPCWANWWTHENLDNAMTGLHDHGMYRKYGYGRGAAQISVDIRAGRVTRNEALHWVRERDGVFPLVYGSFPLSAVLDRIGMTRTELMETLDRFTDWSLFDGTEDGRPTLKEKSDDLQQVR